MEKTSEITFPNGARAKMVDLRPMSKTVVLTLLKGEWPETDYDILSTLNIKSANLHLYEKGREMHVCIKH